MTTPPPIPPVPSSSGNGEQQPPQYGQPPQQYGQPQYGQVPPQYGQAPQPPQYAGPQGYGQQPSGPLGTSDPDDLTLPLYGATFGQAITRWLKNYVNFSGRASRSEFWWVALVNGIVTTVLYTLAMIGTASTITTVQSQYGSYTATSAQPSALAVTANILLLLYALGFLLPNLGLAWRRLHDTDKSGGFYFLSFIPFVGGIIVLVLLALESKPTGVRFDRR